MTAKKPRVRRRGADSAALTPRSTTSSALIAAQMRAGGPAKSRIPTRPPVSPQVRAQVYVDSVLEAVRPQLIDRIQRLVTVGSPVPAPEELAEQISAGLPDAPSELDPYFADLGPFYDTNGAARQLGGVTKQALDSRRHYETVLAMRTGDGNWLYPAWQFNGHGSIHEVLVPVLKALRDLDRWAAGVWLVADHPDLDGRSPRLALAEQVVPDVVARLALNDKAALLA